MNRHIKFPVLAILISIASTVACAAQGKLENDALTIINAKVPLVKAVTTAEQYAHGKATRAEYENSKYGWVYDVEVVSGTRVVDVKIGADNGAVILSVADETDEADDDKKD